MSLYKYYYKYYCECDRCALEIDEDNRYRTKTTIKDHEKYPFHGQPFNEWVPTGNIYIYNNILDLPNLPNFLYSQVQAAKSGSHSLY